VRRKGGNGNRCAASIEKSLQIQAFQNSANGIEPSESEAPTTGFLPRGKGNHGDTFDKAPRFLFRFLLRC
jgi:hypothetical protein